MAGTVVWSGQFNNVADPIPATDCDRLWWRFPDPAEPGRRIGADLAARRLRQAPGWPGRADQKACSMSDHDHYSDDLLREILR
jgi:hypothetical protein